MQGNLQNSGTTQIIGDYHYESRTNSKVPTVTSNCSPVC